MFPCTINGRHALDDGGIGLIHQLGKYICIAIKKNTLIPISNQIFIKSRMSVE